MNNYNQSNKKNWDIEIFNVDLRGKIKVLQISHDCSHLYMVKM